MSWQVIKRSSDNDSTGFWPPGSLHTIGADGYILKRLAFCVDWNSLYWIYFVGKTYNRVYIWCCKYGENRYCERCANKLWCASKHSGLLNSCLGKWYPLPYLVVPLISATVPLISTRVSAHCQAILLRLSCYTNWFSDILCIKRHVYCGFRHLLRWLWWSVARPKTSIGHNSLHHRPCFLINVNPYFTQEFM